MDRFINQIDDAALRLLLSRSILTDTGMIQVGSSRHIEDMNEEGARITKLNPMEQIDQILSKGALAALCDCISSKVPHTVVEELDETEYNLEIVPQRDGALLVYMRFDRSQYDGSLRIIQKKSSEYMEQILGTCIEIKDKDKETSDKLRKQCLQMIRMMSHSDFLHVQQTSEELKLTMEDICYLCKSISNEVEKHTGRVLLLDLPDRCAAPVNLRLFKTALYNLVTNALEATPENEDVTLSVSSSLEYVTVTVADRGRGLSPQLFEDLLSGWRHTVSFDEFRYLVRERAQLGFGLPLAKYIAQLHGGTLFLTPNEGGGSKLHISIARQSLNAVRASKLHEPTDFDDLDEIDSGYSLEDLEFSIYKQKTLIWL